MHARELKSLYTHALGYALDVQAYSERAPLAYLNRSARKYELVSVRRPPLRVYLNMNSERAFSSQ